MDREYLDEDLRRAATDPAAHPRNWDAQDAEDFRVLVQFARAARFASDLRNMRMLRIEPDRSDLNAATATLSSGRQIDLTFKDGEGPGVVVFGSLTSQMDSAR